MEIAKIYRYFKESTGICTDTRKIINGCMFVAIKGDNFDGNDFVKAALNSGAAYALTNRKGNTNQERCIVVEDTLAALQQLANYHRNRFTIPMLALTGSNGKTTTKELIVSILSKKYNLLYTKGNLNNHIGVPLTLLQLNQQQEFAIIEMGANHQGEITNLCKIAGPTYGLITNIGKAHLEGFGGIEGVIKGKTELYQYIHENGRLLFVNQDDKVLEEKSREISRMFYGQQAEDIRLIDDFPFLVFQWGDHILKTQINGKYNLQNIMAALKIGRYFRVEPEQIIDGIQNYIPENNRSQVLEKAYNTILLDAYNANPTSMELAVENAANYQTERKKKILILGDMLEMGEESKKLHHEVLEKINEEVFDQVILVGPEFRSVAPESMLTFSDSPEAREYLRQYPPEDALILIKGSRGLAMEKVLDAIP